MYYLSCPNCLCNSLLSSIITLASATQISGQPRSMCISFNWLSDLPLLHPWSSPPPHSWLQSHPHWCPGHAWSTLFNWPSKITRPWLWWWKWWIQNSRAAILDNSHLTDRPKGLEWTPSACSSVLTLSPDPQTFPQEDRAVNSSSGELKRWQEGKLWGAGRIRAWL